MPNNKIIDLERLSRFKDKLDLELEKKANVDGNYPTMTVGAADSLTPYGENSGANDTTPFVFQSTGGSSDVGSKAYLRELRGNSVAFNQLCNNTAYVANKEQNGITFTHNQDGSWTVTGTASGGNAFDLTLIGIKCDRTHKYLLKGNTGTGSASTYYLSTNYQGNYFHFDYGEGVIFTPSANTSGELSIAIRVFNGTSMGTGGVVFKPQLFDLTLMFGAGNEPTSVLEFNRLFPKPYYDYNVGSLLSCKVNGVKNVGYNAYDNANPNDYIRVVAGQTYTLEGSGSVALYDFEKNLLDDTFVSESALPDNCHFVKITGGDSTTCFHLTWDGTRTGYEPYEKWEYNLPNVELRSNPNTGTYDEIRPDGTYIQRVDIRAYQSGDESDNSVFTDKTNTIYDLQTPVEIQDDNYKYQQIQDIDDFGTQEFLYDSDIDIPIPQGNDFFYPVDYKAFIDSLGGREDIEYAADQVVSQEQLSASEAARDTIDAQLKDAIGGTLRQLLSYSKSVDFNNTDVIDLGSLTWGYVSASSVFYATVSGKKASNNNILSSMYQTTSNGINEMNNMEIRQYYYGTAQDIIVKNTSYSDAATFKTAMKNVLLAYEKA